MRFRKNGSILYNSRATGRVEGRYQYQPAMSSMAESKPQKNLTIWLPQPGRVAVLDFELRFLGGDRIQLKPILEESGQSQLDSMVASKAVVFKRAEADDQESDALDETPPLVSANPN